MYNHVLLCFVSLLSQKSLGSEGKMLRLIIYALIFALWVLSLAYDVQYIPVPQGQNWFHKLKYLTIINLVLQTVYFSMCFVRSIIDTIAVRSGHGPHTRHPEQPTYYTYSKFHAVCDFVYGVVAFPVAVAVCAMFWGLYAIDRELVYPEALDKIIPQWLNHVMHTAPVFFILVDTLLVCHRMPPRSEGIRYPLSLSFIYNSSIFAWYYVDGEWIYPIFEVLNLPQRVLLCVFTSAVMVLLYLIGDTLNRLVWGPACHPPAKASGSQQGRFYSPAGTTGRRKLRKNQ